MQVGQGLIDARINLCGTAGLGQFRAGQDDETESG